MKSCEELVLKTSEYYNYTPSLDAKRAFFYPICIGHFYYEANYVQKRTSFDSFLLMYIQKGELEIDQNGHIEKVTENQFVLLDCYQPHGYRSDCGWECMWFHFDGIVARDYYQMITEHLGIVFTLPDSLPVLQKMTQIYHTFDSGETIREALISKQISDILTSFLLYTPTQAEKNTESISMEEILSYINEHFINELSVEGLAKRAMLSPYHFIRIFKKETGFTPHEYLVHTRISNAKYLLKTSSMSVKDICYNCGFSNESVFCTAFKKNVGMTPIAYRKGD